MEALGFGAECGHSIAFDCHQRERDGHPALDVDGTRVALYLLASFEVLRKAVASNAGLPACPLVGLPRP